MVVLAQQEKQSSSSSLSVTYESYHYAKQTYAISNPHAILASLMSSSFSCYNKSFKCDWQLQHQSS